MIKFSLIEKGKNVRLGILNIIYNRESVMRKSFYYIGKDLVTYAAISILSKNKSGNTYLIETGPTGKPLGRPFHHRASAPGEAPANLFGSLRKSLDYTISSSHDMEFGAKEVSKNGIKVGYARILEHGGVVRIRGRQYGVEPRPYIARSVKNNYRNMQKRFEKDIIKLERGKFD